MISSTKTYRLRFLKEAIQRLNRNILSVSESQFTDKEKYDLIELYKLQRAEYQVELNKIKRDLFEKRQQVSFSHNEKTSKL